MEEAISLVGFTNRNPKKKTAIEMGVLLRLNKNFLATIMTLFISFLVFELTSIDLYIQDIFYNVEGKQWILDRNAAIPKLIFYNGIKKVFIAFLLSLLMMLLFFQRKPIIIQYKKGLTIVLLSCILVPLVVAFLKVTTNIPCPKNIERYGGNYPYVTVLTEYPSTFQQKNNIKCFPAGHASGGFALMSLFFLFSTKKSKIIALVSAVIIGWTTGAYKMFIGDHFLSHTVITMILAWLIILFVVYGTNRFNLYKGKKYQVSSG